VTFEAYKREHFHHAEQCGEVMVAPIGLPPALVHSAEHWLNASTPSQFAALFQRRPAASHKGSFGHVLVVGGAAGTTGAAAMAGMSALRAGAGLVTVSACTQQGFPPELMTAPLSADALKGKSVLAIGPGLGNTPESATLVRNLVTQAQVPVVLDADALNVLGDTPPRGCILTPHPGEMSRLTGIATAEVQASRIETARRYATEKQCTLVLKGAQTVVAFADGAVWINTTGNPGMATGGAGDILTGLIAGLVAQFPSNASDAVLVAVWLHGRAGDLAKRDLGEKCLIATDLLRYLPEAMRPLQPDVH
jgi:NAD(P)H-hydrate epimerase